MSGHICAIPRLEDTTCGCRQLQTVQSCLTQEVFCPLTGTDGPLRSGKWPRTNVPYLHTILDVQGIIPQGSQAYSFHRHGFQVWFWQYFAVVTPCRPRPPGAFKEQHDFDRNYKLENVRNGKLENVRNILLENVLEKLWNWKMSNFFAGNDLRRLPVGKCHGKIEKLENVWGKNDKLEMFSTWENTF